MVKIAPGADQPQRAMDPHFYTEREVFEREMEKIFSRSWLFACHESQIPAAGDFHAFMAGDQNLFCIRNAEGKINAFYNVCAHRAHELVSGSGSKKLVTCPYHAWTYDLDGALRRAPGSEHSPGFDASAVCLTGVRTEVFLGFVFVNLDDEAPGMDESYPGVRADLKEFLPTIERLRPIHRIDFTAESNWKVAVENYNECYHCRVVHSSFATGVVKPDTYNVVPNGSSFRHVAESAEESNYDYDKSSSPHAGEYSSFYLWPTFSFQIYPGALLNTFCWRPESVDRTPFFREWFSVDGAEDPMVKEVAVQDAETTVAEDLRLVASVQRGLKSKGYRPGPLVINPDQGLNSEHPVAAFQQLVLDAIGE